jgi:hypothetical protein
MNTLITERINFYLQALYRREHEDKLNASMVKIKYNGSYRHNPHLKRPYVEVQYGNVEYGYASKVPYSDIWNVDNFHDWEDMPLIGQVRYAQNSIADYWYGLNFSNGDNESWLREHIQNITGIKGLPDDLTDEQLWKIGMKNS